MYTFVNILKFTSTFPVCLVYIISTFMVLNITIKTKLLNLPHVKINRLNIMNNKYTYIYNYKFNSQRFYCFFFNSAKICPNNKLTTF